MLAFDNLSLTIDNKPLIYPVSGEILDNQLIVLTGSSGSGKSLLLRLFSSLLPPTTGQLLWQGQTLSHISPALWRHHVAFVQQHSELIDGLVYDNLALPFSLKFYQYQQFNPKFHYPLLASLGKNPDFLQKSSQDLSGGERQIVNLLRYLQLQPKLLLLDEPTSALDSQTAKNVVDLLIHWQSIHQSSMVWISHDILQINMLRSHGATHWQMCDGLLSCY